MNIGERIKKRREDLDMSVEALAKRIGKSRATIYRYENGFIEKLPTDVLIPFADALQTTPEFLMGWTDDPTARRNSECDAIKTKILEIYDHLGIDFRRKLLDRAEELKQIQDYTVLKDNTEESHSYWSEDHKDRIE